ncbi:hypothetical protein BDR05DRAFT_946518 [Suillus weaverae]|nr:hypothetical protein BDR05DRAFT_946518 [Suillus weaverae]
MTTLAKASIILNCVGPSLPLLSTWVAVDVQEAFYSAFHVEQACQAKMCCAQAEIELYTVAIANAHEFNFSDNISGHADQQYGLQLLMALQNQELAIQYMTKSLEFRMWLAYGQKHNKLLKNAQDMHPTTCASAIIPYWLSPPAAIEVNLSFNLSASVKQPT